MPTTPMPVRILRQMLGTEAESLTDTELTQYRDQLYQISNVILDAYAEFSGRDDLSETLLADQLSSAALGDLTDMTLGDWLEGLT